MAPASRSTSRTSWQWLTLVWLVGAGGVLGVMAALHLRMLSCVRRGRVEPPPATHAMLLEACALAGRKRAPALMITDAVQAPALFGIVRPAILLPRELAANCEPASLKLIFLHELAHLRRLDLCTQVAASLVSAMHWFNPAVWWAARRMRAEAEMAADAHALRWTNTGEAHRMGEVLLSFAHYAAAGWVVWLMTSATLLGITENKRDLRHRIESLTDLARGRRTWWLMGLAAFVALAIAGFTKAPAEDAAKNPAQPTATSAPIAAPPGKAGAVTVKGATKGAKILTLSVPAPRGEIVDRNGIPLAQSMVVHFPCLDFPLTGCASPAERIQFVRKRLDVIRTVLGRSYDLKDAQILEHYDKRRWLPLVLSRMPLTDEEKPKFQAIALDGISLRPAGQRIYPRHEVAGHVIGYVGERGPWASGEILDNEALWPTSQGVRGIEKEYEKYLKGRPGTIQIILDEKGNRVEENTAVNPVPGGKVVLSIDLEMQELAERLLRERVKRGAFVVMDVPTGDVLALASHPNFDPNEFVSTISSQRLNELQSDPAGPMLGRAFQAVYPPASTFMSIAGIGILRAGSINESTIFPCPRSFRIGDRVAYNWAKEDEGEMNMMGALTRSCITWFFQAALQTNSAYISRAGEIFGYGRPTGIRMGEETGIMPTNEWYRDQFGYPIGKADLANIVIGQGAVEATPVQVARAMGAIGNRKSLLDARLVLRIQNSANHVFSSFDVSSHPLNVSQHDFAVVHQGMFDVVHHERGTGKAAAHARLSISGKTGAGQWIPSKKQKIAWFCGFAPSKFPVHSFAVLCEGEPGEEVQEEGNKAAMLLGAFYQEYLTSERLEALEERSRAIAAADAALVDSVQLGVATIIREK